MLSKFLFAWFLIALCVTTHAAGLTVALHWLQRQQRSDPGFWRSTWLFTGVAGRVILLHIVEITAWAAGYAWQGALGDVTTALYFSAVTYTTTGYGDVVLPPEWRLVGGVEALTGILMCGWSTGFFFAVVSRLHWGPRGNPAAGSGDTLDTEAES